MGESLCAPSEGCALLLARPERELREILRIRSPRFASGGARVHSCSRLPRRLDECCIPMKGGVSSVAALTIAPDEERKLEAGSVS